MRLRYIDAAGHTVELPSQRYIVGALLNTSHYGSLLRMAPDVVSDDGLFDVKLIRATPRFMYPLMFAIILTGQYDLSQHTMTLAPAISICRPRPHVAWKWMGCPPLPAALLHPDCRSCPLIVPPPPS